MKISFNYKSCKKLNLFLIIFFIVTLTACNSAKNPDLQSLESEINSFGINKESTTTEKLFEGDPSSFKIVTASQTNLSDSPSTPIPNPINGNDKSEEENEIPQISIPSTSTMTPPNTPSPTNTPWTYWSYVTFTPTPSTSFFRINNLGAYSYVLSPVVPEALVSAGEDGLVIVELLGEGGRSISKENINYTNYIGQRFGIAPEIYFELETISEYGRLIIYTRDRYDRIMDLTSVELILLDIGSNSITTPTDDKVPVIIRQPEEFDVIKGGVIRITGVARILSDSPVIIECIDPSGNVVGDAMVEVDPPTNLVSHIPFEAFLPYTVSEKTNVRFTYRQDSASRLPGTIYLSSFEIILEP